jgi:hypothetical protein
MVISMRKCLLDNIWLDPFIQERDLVIVHLQKSLFCISINESGIKYHTENNKKNHQAFQHSTNFSLSS